MIKSKYEISKILDKLIVRLEKRYDLKISSQYTEFLEKTNVAVFDNDCYIKINDQDIAIDTVLGFSKEEDEDLNYINEIYENRIPRGHLAIATVNDSDLLCISNMGKIYYWNHEINDLYFDKNNTNHYLEQNEQLLLVASDFNNFIKNIFYSEVNDDDDDDDDLCNLPFLDTAIEFMAKNPNIFFSQPIDLIKINLKRLELSKKGKELLKDFKEKNLF